MHRKRHFQDVDAILRTPGPCGRSCALSGATPWQALLCWPTYQFEPIEARGYAEDLAALGEILVLPSAPATREQAQHAVQQAREDRSQLLVDLQAQVRRLQQQITDLIDDVDTTPEGDARRATMTAQLARFEDELEQKQRELARYQGRI